MKIRVIARNYEIILHVKFLRCMLKDFNIRRHLALEIDANLIQKRITFSINSK